MQQRRPLHELLGSLGGLGAGPDAGLAPGSGEEAPVGAGQAPMGGEMAPPGGEPAPMGAPEVPQMPEAPPGGEMQPESPLEGGQAPEMEQSEEDIELQQMQQALEDPQTPPEVREMVQMQLEMAARRHLALGGQS